MLPCASLVALVVLVFGGTARAADWASVLDRAAGPMAERIVSSAVVAGLSTPTVTVEAFTEHGPPACGPAPGALASASAARWLFRGGSVRLVESVGDSQPSSPRARFILRGAVTCLGDRLRLSGRLLESGSGIILAMEEQELPPSLPAAMSGPPRIAEKSPEVAGRPSVWGSAQSLLRPGSPAPGWSVGLAVRNPAGRWELGLDVGQFRLEDNSDFRVGGSGIRTRHRTIHVVHLRPKLSFLYPLERLGVPGLLQFRCPMILRFGAGPAIDFLAITHEERGGGLATLDAPEDRAQFDYFLEAGFTRPFLGAWELQFLAEHLRQTTKGFAGNLPYEGWAARVGVARRFR